MIGEIRHAAEQAQVSTDDVLTRQSRSVYFGMRAGVAPIARLLSWKNCDPTESTTRLILGEYGRIVSAAVFGVRVPARFVVAVRLKLRAGQQACEATPDRIGANADSEFLISGEGVADGQVTGVDVVVTVQALAG